MATFKLGDDSWKSLEFPEKVWGSKPEYSTSFMVDLYPKVEKVTSLSENKDFRWFFGKFVCRGGGHLVLTYPEVIEGLKLEDEEVLSIPNYCFSYIPFLKIVAEGEKFKGWFNFSTEELLQKERELIISDDIFENVTTFLAQF